MVVVHAKLRSHHHHYHLLNSDLLVGVSRTVTDFAYVGYMTDIAVRKMYQRRGIGIQLTAHARALMGPDSFICLLADEHAVDYYPKIGYTEHPR